MRHFALPSSLLLAAYVGAVAAGPDGGHRVLRAATKRSDLHKREMKIERRYETEVVYIEEENGWNGRETFASSVKVGSKKPILNLEEIEGLLENVECQDGKMMLHFVDASTARDAKAACLGGHGGMGGLIVTSHHSCNREGERAVYMVDDISLAKEGVALDLAVTQALWQDAFDNLDINFGHTRYDHIYRRHSNFLRARKKRQDEVELEIPADAPNVTDVTFDLTSEVLDKTFTADDFLSGIDSLISLPTVPELPIEIGCKNCTTRGQIVLTQGAIKIDTKGLDLVPDIFDGGDDGKSKGLTSILKGGYMELAVKGLGARLEMFARPKQSGSYQLALFPLPVLGFTIPGIGQAGASFEPKISVDFEIDGEIAVNYGIDVAIPDGAGIKVELGELAKTALTGIKGSTLNALPFTTNVSDADIALSVAFTPTIPIGFEFSDKLSALVTVALDLPRLDAKLTTNAKDQCALLDKSKKEKKKETRQEKEKEKDVAKPKPKDLSSLVLVEANISVVVGVSADLTLPLLPAPLDSAGTSISLFSTEFPLMTSCVDPVKGALKITSMAPMATITADKAKVTAAGVAGNATCTKHAEDKPCDCGATVTTTVYAAPPTDVPPVTTAVDGGAAPPPGQTPPPVELTPYNPGDVPTPPTNPEGPQYPVETPTGGAGAPPQGPQYPPPSENGDGGYGNNPPPENPASPPPGEGDNGYGNSPPPSNPANPPPGDNGYGNNPPPENPANPPTPPLGDDNYGTNPPPPPNDGGYGNPPPPPPSTSTLCSRSSTIRITISTPPPQGTQPPVSGPPITIISAPASKPCNSSIPVPTAPATGGGDGGAGNGYGQPPVTQPGAPPQTQTQDGGYGGGNNNNNNNNNNNGQPPQPPQTQTQTEVNPPPAPSGPATQDGGYGPGNPPATPSPPPPPASQTGSPPPPPQTQTGATQTDASQPPTSTLSTATSSGKLEESKGFMGDSPPATTATTGTATGTGGLTSKTQPPEFTGAAVRAFGGSASFGQWTWAWAWQVGVLGVSLGLGAAAVGL